MTINVCNREQIEALDPSFGEPKVLVSISSPEPFGTGPANLNEGWVEVLRLEFHDATLGDLAGRYVLFDQDMAHQILEFFKKHADKEFWVHCDAGMSRSMAVGSFFNMLTARELVIHTPGIPDDTFRNIHVFSTLRRAWYQIEDES